MAILSVEDLVVDFQTMEGATRAVDGASLTVRAGRTTALVGESGSGKSVMSQAIMGLLPSAAQIVSGAIRFHDPKTGGETDIARLSPGGPEMRALRGNRIAIIFQEPMTSLSPLHTVGDQISEAARIHHALTPAQARAHTRDMLALTQFPDPERALDSYPFELSGGLRQRAMISMALICRPALLIADEPTTALDVTIQAEILRLLKELQAELGMAILLITHDFGVVANMAEDVSVIYRGRIMESGSVEDIFRTPRHPYLKALLHAVPRFSTGPDERLVPLREIKVDSLPRLRPEAKGAKLGEPILRVKDVTKTFTLRKRGGETATVRALDAVSFTVKRGECLGLVGESGSGKTTISMAILRALQIDGGEIGFDLDGRMRDISSLTGADLATFRRRVQVVFQDPYSSLNPRMPIYQVLCEPFQIHKLYDRATTDARIRDLIRLVGLEEKHLRRYPHSFSGGQRQRIGIARALALEPELLLLDEPVSALDVSVQAQVLNLLRDLRKTLGLTYLFVSHNLAVVDYLSDRIAVMCRGNLVEIADKTSLINNPQHPYTKALLGAVPEPSLDEPLDFAALADSRASVPDEWPEPYRHVPGTATRMLQVGPEHFVLVSANESIAA